MGLDFLNKLPEPAIENILKSEKKIYISFF